MTYSKSGFEYASLSETDLEDTPIFHFMIMGGRVQLLVFVDTNLVATWWLRFEGST